MWDRPGLETLWRDSGSLLKQGHSIFECLLQLPRLLASEVVWLLPLSLAALLALIGRRHGPRPWVLAIAVLLGLAAWSCTGSLPRFLVPTTLLLLALASAVRGEKVVRWTATAAIVWMCAVGLWRTAGWMQLIRPVSLIPLDVRGAGSRISPNHPGAAFFDAQYLPDDSRTLFIAETRGFLFPHPFESPSQHDPSPMQSIVEGNFKRGDRQHPHRAGLYPHPLVNWGELRRLSSSYPVAPWTSPAGRDRWMKIVRDLQPPVVNRDGVAIYELAGSRHDPPIFNAKTQRRKGAKPKKN